MLSLQLRQELSQQQKLEQKIEQKVELNQKLSQKVSLELYLEVEDFMKGLIRKVNNRNSWKNFNKHDFKFTYAAVKYAEVKHIVDVTGPGFAHCQYNMFDGIQRGDWTLFVVTDMIPTEFEQYVALHERGEQLSLGNHYFASKLEFAAVGKDWITKKYASWIDQKMPTKFTDLTIPVLFPLIPDDFLDELRNMGNDVDEQRHAEDFIEENPLPELVMKKALTYEQINQDLISTMIKSIGPAQQAIYNASLKSGDPNVALLEVQKILKNNILTIHPKLLSVYSDKIVAEKFIQAFEIIKDSYIKTYDCSLQMKADTIKETLHLIRENKPFLIYKNIN
ncbi:hypothetical protein COV13_02615 [Candidatus Woesearchaeota archaeon CG10_big_fil_rev_8_21_14_0_10_32_9]|nr:MAG: hypothetical protein COV13_02615 [Candidatus Woesearchaeota archaeon CG10_big_fil_rev_8_21_14_0_10_32_9]